MNATVVELPCTIAHRGLSAHAPENTLSAVRAAFEAGCRWVELDVQQLGDGTPVIWHDAGIRRCSDGRGKLRKLSLAQVSRFDVGSWFSGKFHGERIATLGAVLGLIDKLGMGLNLELKVSRGHAPDALAKAVIPALLETLPASRLIVSSFSHEALVAARACEPDPTRLPLGILSDRLDKDWQHQVEQLSAYSLHLDWRRLKASQAHAIKASDTHLLCYTVNDPAVARRLWAWGADSLISNDPARLAEDTDRAG
ncbi:glycerophosphodiester phosphodiesterase family protein [Halomonas shantousis]